MKPAQETVPSRFRAPSVGTYIPVGLRRSRIPTPMTTSIVTSANSLLPFLPI